MHKKHAARFVRKKLHEKKHKIDQCTPQLQQHGCVIVSNVQNVKLPMLFPNDAGMLEQFLYPVTKSQFFASIFKQKVC